MHVGAAMCFTVDDLQAARADTRAGVVSQSIGAATEDMILSARINCVGILLVGKTGIVRTNCGQCSATTKMPLASRMPDSLPGAVAIKRSRIKAKPAARLPGNLSDSSH
jgi:hypothetical protein